MRWTRKLASRLVTPPAGRPEAESLADEAEERFRDILPPWWMQDYRPLKHLRECLRRRPAYLGVLGAIIWIITVLPRWAVSRGDRVAYARGEDWVAFWPGESWVGHSVAVLSAALTFTLGFLLTIGAVPAWQSRFPSVRYILGATTPVPVSRIDAWSVFSGYLLISAVLLGLTSLLAWRRSRVQKNLDSQVLSKTRELLKLRSPEAKLDSQSFQEEVFLKLRVAVPMGILREQIGLYVADESEIRKQAESEMMRFLPPLPRNAKRMLNQLRLMLGVAYLREMFTAQTGLTGEHFGKWVVLRERWEALAERLAENPEKMKALEAAAKDPKRFAEILRSLNVRYRDEDALREFCRTSKRLGPVLARIVHFK